MYCHLEDYINRVTWLGPAHRIANWEQKGLRHGFEGCGYQPSDHVFSLQQIHSSRIVRTPAHLPVDSSILGEGDGLWCSHAGGQIAIKTADCVPILLAHTEGVMALHAGWKGLMQDIVGEAMRFLQTEPATKGSWREIDIAIGPCISLDSFEVGSEVLEQFRLGPFHMHDYEFAFASCKGLHDRWHLDLGLLTVLQLQRFDIDPRRISIIRSCTKKDPQLWHSYRRDGAQAGRNWSWIRFDRVKV